MDEATMLERRPHAARRRSGVRMPLSRSARLVTTWNVAVGGTALVAGGHELIFAGLVSYRIEGVTLLAIAFGLLAATAGFQLRQSWAYSYTVVTNLAAAIFALVFLVAQLLNYDSNPRIAFWLVVTVVCIAAAVAMGREGRVSFAGLARRRAKVISSVLSVGALLSIAQFWNATVRVPQTAAPSVTITSELQKVDVRGDLVRLEGNVKIKSTAASKLWILGSIYNLLGGTAKAQSKSPGQFRKDVEWSVTNEELTNYPATHYANKRLTAAIETGQLSGDLVYLVPGEEVTYHLTFYAPADRYDFLRLETVFAVAKESLLLEDSRPQPTRAVTIGGIRNIDAVRPVRETSWLGWILRGSRVEHVDVMLDGSWGFLWPRLNAYVDRRGAPPSLGTSRYSDRMRRLYGIAQADSIFELALT